VKIAAAATVNDSLDRPMRDLRLSVTDNCNLRCSYCMPCERFGQKYQFLNERERLSYVEIARLVSVFASLGVRKVKITGGEPLLRPRLHELINRIASVPGITDIGLITNGYCLGEMASLLKSAGLTRVTVSLDTLDEPTWQSINGRGYSVQRVLSAIEEAINAGFGPIKINAVVQRGVNDRQVMGLVERFRGPMYQLRLIEYMDVGTLNQWRREDTVPSAEVRAQVNDMYPLEPVAPSYSGEVASRFRYVDGSGEIGFISSVTEPFCRDCTRARLSADGKLYMCLFAKHGQDLRRLLRSGYSDDEIRQAVAAMWESREDRHSELREGSARTAGVEMYHIGG